MSVASVPKEVRSTRLLVWDFDGVIADTEPSQARAYEVVLAARGVDVEPEWFREWIGTPEAGIWSGLRDRYGIEDSVESLATERGEIFCELALKQHPAWYVPSLLGLPAEQVIVSAGIYDHIDLLLEHWGIRQAFGAVHARALTPAGRPASKMKKLAELASRPRTVLLEDMPKYLTAVRGPLKIGVQHSLNDLSGVPLDFILRIDGPPADSADDGWHHPGHA